MPWPDYQHQLPPESYPRDDGDFRRRQWDDFDYREPPFRGRSRSPLDDGRKRRRSPSPWDRSRYEPRPRYGDDRDFRRDEPGGYGRGNYGRGRPPRPPPPNPYDLDYVVQLKHFAEWFRFAHPDLAAMEERLDSEAPRETDGARPRDGIRARWEKYKKEFAIQQVSIMFDYHKSSPWFAEKYNPSEEFALLRLRVRKEGWKDRLEQFFSELEEGKHDPPVAGTIATNGDSQPIKEHAETLKLETEDAKLPGQEEDTMFGMDAEDDGNDESKMDTDLRAAVDTKRNQKDDSVSVMPEGNEVMIRTIPPDIGRIKLEEACSTVPGFIHLALGEPLQKRNFYRAGWIKFQDDTDMEKAVFELSEKKLDGFKLHVTHTTRPFITRARITPEVASHPERVKKDLTQIKILAGILENEATALKQFDSSQAHVEKASDEPSHTDGGEDQHHASTNGGPERINRDSEPAKELGQSGSNLVERRADKILAQQPGDGAEERLGKEYRRNIVTLDLYRSYLRSAFNTCYYCVAVTDHVEELQRKCVKHTRRPLQPKTIDDLLAKRAMVESNGQAEGGEGEAVDSEKPEGQEGEVDKPKAGETREWKRNDERWLDWLDGKLALLLRRDKIDPRDYGGKDYEDELSKGCEPHIKQEDEGKFRCKQCNKLFKAISFVEKHVANKHPELLKHLDELPYYNNFALDPHRMQPFSHPPQQAGSGGLLPPQAYGLKGTGISAPPDYRDGRGAPPFGLPPGIPPPPYGAPYGAMEGSYGPGPWNNLPPPGMFPAPDNKMLPHRLSDRPGNVEGGGGGGRRPPPPPDVREDPRGGRKISYHDIDRAAAGDDVNIELSY